MNRSPGFPLSNVFVRGGRYRVYRGGYCRANVADIHPPKKKKVAPEQLLNERTSKSLWVHRSDCCPLLFQNLLRFFRYGLHNVPCRADCVHERCAFACGQAHFFKITSRFRSRKDGSKLWHQVFSAAKHRFADDLWGIRLWWRLRVIAFPLTYHAVAYHAHRSVGPLGTENASPRNILLRSLRNPALVFVVCVCLDSRYQPCQLGKYLRIGPGTRKLNGSDAALVQGLTRLLS